MKFELEFDRTYPHPAEKVWHALTDPGALGTWLMETDFVPEHGRSFQMRCENEDGKTDTYLCSVIELEPPHRMVWSWILDGMQQQGKARIEFNLREVPGGTELTIRHSGDWEPSTVERFKGGWPVKLQQLEDAL